MPQRILSKFKSLSIRGKKRFKKHEIESDSNDSDIDDDVDLYSNDVLSLVTRSGPLVLKRQEMFEKIFKSGVPQQINNIDCIIGCGNTRNTVLYPCRHMHLCRECWFLLKTYENKNLKNISFDDSDDDTTKPRCPLCRNGVDSSEEVYL